MQQYELDLSVLDDALTRATPPSKNPDPTPKILPLVLQYRELVSAIRMLLSGSLPSEKRVQLKGALRQIVENGDIRYAAYAARAASGGMFSDDWSLLRKQVNRILDNRSGP